MIPPIKTDHDQYIYVQFERFWVLGLLKEVDGSTIVVEGSASGSKKGVHTINLDHVVYYTPKTKEEAVELLARVGLDPLFASRETVG